MTIVRVIDFECTGIEPSEGAEVCEVGVCDVDVEGRRIELPKSWLCGVEKMPPEVRAVHHIALGECAGLPPFDASQMLPPDIKFLAAHNSSYETKFFTPTIPVICTYKAALRVWPEAPAHNNGAIRYWLEDQGKIAPDHALTQPSHRAGPDAYVTAHILVALLDAGVTGKDMVGWTKEPALLPTCPIGEWRGKPWSAVDSGFLGWMLRKVDMDPDLKWNSEREIARRSGR